jgi:hypothetical protein
MLMHDLLHAGQVLPEPSTVPGTLLPPWKRSNTRAPS